MTVIAGLVIASLMVAGALGPDWTLGLLILFAIQFVGGQRSTS